MTSKFFKPGVVLLFAFCRYKDKLLQKYPISKWTTLSTIPAFLFLFILMLLFISCKTCNCPAYADFTIPA